MKFFPPLNDKGPKERFTVGLDLGTSSIKLVRISNSKEKAELSGFSIEGVEADLEPVLRRMADPQDTKKINISVSGPSTIIRYVNFPKMNGEELRQSLKFEAQKHIPFSVQEIELDAAILKPELPENKMLVLLAAVKKDFLAQRLKLFEGIGYTVSFVDIDSIALINGFNRNYSEEETVRNKTIALLNIGSSFSNLSILEDGIPRLSRDIAIAGNSITQRLADVFNISFKEAEALKLNPDKEREAKLAVAIEPVIGNLAGDVRTSFDYYESQSTTSVGTIYLSGAGSRCRGLKDSLAGLLGITVEYWDPFKKVSISPDIPQEKLREASCQLAVAFGCALRS